MSALTISRPGKESAWSKVYWGLRDGWTIAGREFQQLKHQPGELIGALLFPAIMVVMFGYVFGSAIGVPGGGNYREYLMPGLFAMMAILGTTLNALLISKDIAEGVMDRFRSMPMARSAIPLGRAASDLVTVALGLVIMALIGLVVGWRAHNGVWSTLAAFGLILLMRFAASWIGIVIGLSAKPETVDAWVPIVFPISMISNSFVPTEGMPGWLRLVSDWNPISSLVAACRELFGNPGVAVSDAAWPLQHPVAATLVWSGILLAIFVPLATWRYKKAGR